MRYCSFCKLRIPDGESAMQAKNYDELPDEIRPGAWAHFTCWYDGGGPFERERIERATAELFMAVGD